MHTRHRPQTWDEVLGNEIVKKSLRSMNLEKPILLLGEPGLGKTTIAYILAREFGVPKENIVHYNGFDLLVDDIRTIAAQINTPTLFGEKKAIIIDEIHGIPDRAQQDLLIPLENLKGNTLVVACTTTVEKVKTALVDRFKPFTLRPISDTDALSLINRVCEKESIKIPKQVKALIVEKSRGVPRRILTGLDKVKSVDDAEEASYLLELSILGEESSDILTLLKVLMHRPIPSWDDIKKVLKDTLKKKSPQAIRVGLMNLTKARIMSDYLKSTEVGTLLNFYDIISSPLSPDCDESDLIINLLKVSRG